MSQKQGKSSEQKKKKEENLENNFGGPVCWETRRKLSKNLNNNSICTSTRLDPRFCRINNTSYESETTERRGVVQQFQLTS